MEQERSCSAPGNIGGRGGKDNSEIRPHFINAQAVKVIFSAVAVCCENLYRIDPVLFRCERYTGVCLMMDKPDLRIFGVIIFCKDLSFFIHDDKCCIQRGIVSSCQNFQHFCFAFFPFETETVTDLFPVQYAVNPYIVFYNIFFSSFLCHTFHICRKCRERPFFKCGFSVECLHSVNKIGSAAVNGIPYGKSILPIGGNSEGKNGVYISVKVIGKSNAFPFIVKDFCNSLEMAGNTVAQEGGKFSCPYPEGNHFSLFCLKEKFIHLSAGHDLAIEIGGNGKGFHRRFLRRDLCSSFIDLRFFSYVEGDGIAYPCTFACQTELPSASFCIFIYFQRDQHLLTDGGT